MEKGGTLTTGDVLAHIKQQLDWRGPSGKSQGHIVMGREEAAFLHQRVLELIRIQDGHIAEIEALKNARDSAEGMGHS